MTYYYLYKDNRVYKEALFDDLQKYGELKLAIKNLQDIERFEIQKKDTRQTNK